MPDGTNPVLRTVSERRLRPEGLSSLVFAKPRQVRWSLMKATCTGEIYMTSDTATALITGGTSGIGRAAANKLAQLGIHVLVVGRNAERGEKTVDEIRAAGGKADFISADL